MAEARKEPFDLRVKRYFPHVKDFERNEKGDVIWGSLTGPDRIEARQQLSRERAIAAANLKLLQEATRWCYIKNGVNHREECRELVKEMEVRLRTPQYGMLGGPSHDDKY